MMIKGGMSLEPIKSDVSDAMNVTSAEPLEQTLPLKAESEICHLDRIHQIQSRWYILLLSFLQRRRRRPCAHILRLISHFSISVP